MKKTLLSFILVLTAITGAAQTVGDAIYFYRNDGGFNAFFRADIDSITFSTIEGDSTNIDGIMVQTIHTPDSAYEIPLSVIDSVSFVNPETILQPDVVRMDESMLSYLQAVDGMTLVFSTTMPSSLRPKKGDLLLSVVPSNRLLSNGFAGKVTSISETAGTLQVACARVDDVSDIFVQLIGVERIGEDNSEAQARRNAMNTGNIQKQFVSLGLEYTGEPFEDAELKLNGSLNGTLYGTYAYFFNLFNQVLDVKIHHEWDYTIGGEFKIEKSFEWPNENSKYQEKTLWKFLFPVVAPVFKVELTGSPFVKTEGTAETSFNYQSRKYPYLTRIKYEDSKGFEGSSTEPQKESGNDNEPVFDTDFSLNGSLTMGGKFGLSVGTIDFFGGYLRAKADIAIGPKVEAEFNLKGSTEDEFSNFYTQHKDCKLELGATADVEIYGEAKFWGKEKAKKTVFEETFESPFKWERYLLPELDNIYARGTSGNNSTGWCFGRATRPCLFPVNLGFVVADVYNNYVNSFYDSTPYTSEQAYFSADISGLSGGKVTVYPVVKLLDHEYLATPSTELIKVATMPGEKNDNGTFVMKGKVYGAKSDKIGFYYNTTSDLESGHATYVAATPMNNNGDFSATITTPTGNTLYYVAAADLPDHLAQIDEHRGEPQIADIVVDNPDEPTPGQMIDLGLSVKWAGWDVGSDSPEVPGDLYAWGETETKSEYTSENYSHYINDNIGGNWRTTGFYCNIGHDISGTQYDAAHVKWGGSWRMPTKEEAEELLSLCTKKKVTYRGQEGWLLTGPNGNKIFLKPTTTSGNYWTSTWGNYTEQVAWTIHGYTSLSVERKRCSLYAGRRIRAVCD